MKKIFSSNAFFFFFAILISLPLILPYFQKGYFPTHDGEWAVVRLGDMYREIRDFQIPARYSGNLNFGYGYPLFNFAYPFPYYIGVFIHFFHVGFVDTIKFLFAISVPLSFFFMFLVSKKVWKSTIAGFISALIYVYLPYRLVDLYVRGSLGESLAFVFFPAILLALSFLVDNKKTRFGRFFSALLFAALLMTHNIMALYFCVILFVYLLVLFVSKKQIVLRETVFSLFFGLGMAAFFWLPSIVEKKDILLAKIPIADRSLYFVDPFDLIFSKWGYGVPTASNGFSYQLGIPLVIVLFVSVGMTVHMLWKRRLLSNFSSILFVVFVVTALLFIFNMFSSTAFLWHLPLFSDINYPWTLLLPISFLLSFCAGFLVKKSRMFMIGGICISLFAVFLMLPNARPLEYINKGDQFYLTNDATTTSSNEYTPLWVKTLPNQREVEKVVLISGKGKISLDTNTSKTIRFTADVLNDSIVEINTIYYPGWNITVNGEPSTISYANDKGTMRIDLKKGKNRVVASFGETPLRLLGDIVSIGSFIVLFFYCFASQKLLLRKVK